MTQDEKLDRLLAAIWECKDSIDALRSRIFDLEALVATGELPVRGKLPRAFRAFWEAWRGGKTQAPGPKAPGRPPEFPG